MVACDWLIADRALLPERAKQDHWDYLVKFADFEPNAAKRGCQGSTKSESKIESAHGMHINGRLGTG